MKGQIKKSSAAVIILAGGEGTRLKPLTEIRCKPAISFGGRYRIIDVPLSNALHAGFKEIFLISQFMATSLNNYILDTYPAEASHGAHIEILSPEETTTDKVWYQGTADAIRKNIPYIIARDVEYFIILSGDQLYSMDLADMLHFAKETDADLTISTILVGEEDAKRMGVMKIDSKYEIIDFFEKPKDPALLHSFIIDPKITKKDITPNPAFLGSMGIYIFKRKALFDLLKEDAREDFGKHLIPTQLQKGKTFAYIFDGYWEDIGTIASYYHANLHLTKDTKCLDLYNEHRPIFSQSITLPSPRVINTLVTHAIICDGCVIKAAAISHSMIGPKTSIEEGCHISDTILIGWSPHCTRKPISIGKNCTIRGAILDEGVQVGSNVVLINEHQHTDYQDDLVTVRDGIIVIRAGTSLPNNFRF